MGESFATRLERLRSAAGLTQTELAKQAGIAQSLVGMLESGTRDAENMASRCLAGLAQTLNVSMEYLLRGEELPRRLRKRRPATAQEVGRGE